MRYLGSSFGSISGYSISKRRDFWPVSGSFCLITRYPGLPIFWTLRLGNLILGCGRLTLSFCSLNYLLWRLVWCFFPVVCARYEASFVCRVRQRRHSKDPKWFLMIYGSFETSAVSICRRRKRSRRSMLASDEDAMPPEPVLAPGLFCMSISILIIIITLVDLK